MTLLEPVAPLDAKSSFSLGRIKENEACRPSVLNRKLIEKCGDFGPGMRRKAGQANQANVKVIQHGLEARMEFVIAEQKSRKLPSAGGLIGSCCAVMQEFKCDRSATSSMRCMRSLALRASSFS